LIFYYSGHGTVSDNGNFKFCTKTTHMKGTRLMEALKDTKASKILLVVDACHAGGLQCKTDPVLMLKSLAKGNGIAMLGACPAASTTPGSSPLSRTLLDVLDELKPEDIPTPTMLAQRVKDKMGDDDADDSDSDAEDPDGAGSTASTACGIPPPVFQHTAGYDEFILSAGMVVVLKCTSPPGVCVRSQQKFILRAGKGNFGLTQSDFKTMFQCPCCRSQASEVIECRFNECAWRVHWAVREQPRGVMSKVVGPFQAVPGQEHTSLWKKEHPFYVHVDISVRDSMADFHQPKPPPKYASFEPKPALKLL